MTETLFDLATVQRFAALSRDANPLHVDPIAARRSLYGAPVVHGMLLALAALDDTVAQQGGSRQLRWFKAAFSRPVRVGDPFVLRRRHDGDLVEVEVLVAGTSRARLSFELAAEAAGPDAVLLPRPAPPGPCATLSFDAAASASGFVPLTLDHDLLRTLAPHAHARLPARQIAALLATTRIVGMECPGLHSLYADVDLRFTTAPGDTLSYKVLSANRRYSKLVLQLEGGGTVGTLGAFFRPPPAQQLTLDDARSLLHGHEFAAQRALIVGGSRGLGEVTAKLVVAGGGSVVVTYRNGAADAERLITELGAPQARALSLDVLSEDPSTLLDSLQPTHVYYFATPSIQLDASQPFSAQAFAQYCRYYVEGFARLIEPLARAAVEPLHVFYPSSVYVERLEPGAVEYAAAKAAGELVATDLARRLPSVRLRIARLPKARTDQTLALGPTRAADPAPLMLAELRKLDR